MSIITLTTSKKSSQSFTSLIKFTVLVFKSLYHAYKCTGDKVIILNIAPPENVKKRRFSKIKRTPKRVKSETVFVNGLPHYLITATENAFCTEPLFDFLEKYRGRILAPEALFQIEKLRPLMFDITPYLKRCAFSGLCRYLKCSGKIRETLFVADESGALSKEILNVLPYVKGLCVFSFSARYDDELINKAYSAYGVKIVIKPYSEKCEARLFADFDTLTADGGVILLKKGEKKEISPEILRKETEGAQKLYALGIDEKYIYAAL